MFGNCVFAVMLVLFAIKIKTDYIYYLISAGIGIAFGSFASNASALLVQLAKGDLGASALGFVFSVQYLIMAGFIPLVDAISFVARSTIYVVFVGVGLVVLIILLVFYRQLL